MTSLGSLSSSALPPSVSRSSSSNLIPKEKKTKQPGTDVQTLVQQQKKNLQFPDSFRSGKDD